uniref:Uncharacterized protein n=1 Tax=Romanomermis culicivorax TaxID=13658 RepID=A0A915KHD7_ROMCU
MTTSVRLAAIIFGFDKSSKCWRVGDVNINNNPGVEIFDELKFGPMTYFVKTELTSSKPNHFYQDYL